LERLETACRRYEDSDRLPLHVLNTLEAVKNRTQCCERDTNQDGDCDRHPTEGPFIDQFRSELDESITRAADLATLADDLSKELDEEREKVGLLMQPRPEDTGEFPWQMMRLWCLNYKAEKMKHRTDVEDLKERLKEGYLLIFRGPPQGMDVWPELQEWLIGTREVVYGQEKEEATPVP
jgi:hypothetical protein